MLIQSKKFVVFEIIRERVSGGQDSSGGSVIGLDVKHFPTIVQPKVKQWDRFENLNSKDP
ncbi:13180_t:CDS:2, partial [Gigaspora rosea]